MKSTAICLWLAAMILTFSGICAAQDTAPADPTDQTQPLPQTPVQPSSNQGKALTMLQPLMIIGTILLVGWAIKTLRRPEIASLRTSPARSNKIMPLHIAAIVVAWLSPGVLVTLAEYYANEPLTKLRIVGIISTQIILFTGSLLVARKTFSLGIAGGLGLRLNHLPSDFLRSVCTYLVVLPMVVVLLIISQAVLPKESQQINEMLLFLKQVNKTWQIVIVISATVFAPLAEETFFRGILQSMLRERLSSPWLSIVISSMVFSLVHFSSLQDVLPLMPLAVALGYSYERTGRLISPILIHSIFNGVMIYVSLMNMS